MTTAQPVGQRWPSLLAVVLLAAAAVAWAAAPMRGADPGARPVLIAATCCAAASVLRIAAPVGSPRLVIWLRSADDYSPAGQRARLLVSFALSSAPWAQATTVAVLALEALHRAGPWHVAVLGLVLLGYLLALHLAESATRLGVLRPHVPLVIAGVALAGLSAGAAVLPTAKVGSGWLTVVAAIAAIVAAALALPI